MTSTPPVPPTQPGGRPLLPTLDQRPGPPLRFPVRPVAPAVRQFLATEAGGAVLLLAATVIALVWANSPWSAAYEDLWSTTAGLHLGDWSLDMDLHHWVNDAAMAIFFLVIGLEINREVTSGELRNRRTVAVPALGALGGLLVPALIYLAFNAGTDAQHGWGVVMSTDTAFLVGVLALFGPRCPDRLRLFLLTLAVVDDIGAITVMAVFYNDGVWLPGLGIAGVLVVALLVMRWLGVWRLAPYVGVGVALWLAVYSSGVHATLAGVLVGLLIPSRRSRRDQVDDVPGYAQRLREETTAEREHLTELAARAAVPASDRLQRVLHPWSAYVVVPVFGLANAGVQLDAESLSAAMTSRLTIGVAVALVVGNAVGIFGASALALRLGLGDLPGRVRYSHLLGGAMLAGIGFTISLFIAELAFDDEALVEQAKIGILAGSLVAAVAGSVTLRILGERLPLCSPESPGPPPGLPPRPWRAPEAAQDADA
ncbi:Na+/H+ antiporter NhaA [Oerskovia enterophila]|uniref:Na(+)/H(+) antiporter NhaA n=1 Tax=Oerskovia enterophila TaxID=43678 RepID=A0A165S1G2_9CELL|nr:Na+/H+ antiporter NhaA [Oerskovia enterophila]KZM35419.1 Na(+)/H(+) antiporter NhaA [Oerskovia enterophila]